MKSLSTVLFVSMLTGTAVAQPRLDASARISKELAGRTPTAPVACINVADVRSVKVVRDLGVVYITNDGTFYLNRSPGPIKVGIDAYLLTISRSQKNAFEHYCRGDMFQSTERKSYAAQVAFELGNFIPYPRPGRTSAHGASVKTTLTPGDVTV